MTVANRPSVQPPIGNYQDPDGVSILNEAVTFTLFSQRYRDDHQSTVIDVRQVIDTCWGALNKLITVGCRLKSGGDQTESDLQEGHNRILQPLIVAGPRGRYQPLIELQKDAHLNKFRLSKADWCDLDIIQSYMQEKSAYTKKKMPKKAHQGPYLPDYFLRCLANGPRHDSPGNLGDVIVASLVGEYKNMPEGLLAAPDTQARHTCLVAHYRVLWYSVIAASQFGVRFGISVVNNRFQRFVVYDPTTILVEVASPAEAVSSDGRQGWAPQPSADHDPLEIDKRRRALGLPSADDIHMTVPPNALYDIVPESEIPEKIERDESGTYLPSKMAHQDQVGRFVTFFATAANVVGLMEGPGKDAFTELPAIPNVKWLDTRLAASNHAGVATVDTTTPVRDAHAVHADGADRSQGPTAVTLPTSPQAEWLAKITDFESLQPMETTTARLDIPVEDQHILPTLGRSAEDAKINKSSGSNIRSGSRSGSKASSRRSLASSDSRSQTSSRRHQHSIHSIKSPRASQAAALQNRQARSQGSPSSSAASPRHRGVRTSRPSNQPRDTTSTGSAVSEPSHTGRSILRSPVLAGPSRSAASSAVGVLDDASASLISADSASVVHSAASIASGPNDDQAATRTPTTPPSSDWSVEQARAGPQWTDWNHNDFLPEIDLDVHDDILLGTESDGHLSFPDIQSSEPGDSLAPDTDDNDVSLTGDVPTAENPSTGVALTLENLRRHDEQVSSAGGRSTERPQPRDDREESELSPFDEQDSDATSDSRSDSSPAELHAIMSALVNTGIKVVPISVAEMDMVVAQLPTAYIAAATPPASTAVPTHVNSQARVASRYPADISRVHHDPLADARTSVEPSVGVEGDGLLVQARTASDSSSGANSSALYITDGKALTGKNSVASFGSDDSAVNIDLP